MALIFTFISRVFLLIQKIVEFQNLDIRPVFKERHLKEKVLSLAFLDHLHMIDNVSVVVLVKNQTACHFMRFNRRTSLYALIKWAKNLPLIVSLKGSFSENLVLTQCYYTVLELSVNVYSNFTFQDHIHAVSFISLSHDYISLSQYQ